jgi:HK97 gp10 family phage protein
MAAVTYSHDLARMLGVNVASEVSRVMRAGALTGQKLAQQKAAVDTGYMRASVRGTATVNQIKLDAGAEYSEYVEYGTSRMAAQPFMEPAMEQVKEKVVDELGRILS